MELLLERAWPKDTYTIGKFYVNGERFAESMEDRDRGLNQSMSLEDIKKIKVYGETAIPKGRYEVVMSFSAKFSGRAWAKPYEGRTPELLKVPGFSAIRIHPLNSASDSLGCIGVGKNDKKGWISQSTKYYRSLLDKHLIPAFQRGEKVYITIR